MCIPACCDGVVHFVYDRPMLQPAHVPSCSLDEVYTDTDFDRPGHQVRGFGWKVHKSPVPPDTCFLRLKKGEWDAVIAMYHDQGHIPAKMEGFGGTVNVTLGLPIVRTSVDHGTAFDIAGKGIADEENIFQAVTLGATMARGRKQTMGKRKRE